MSTKPEFRSKYLDYDELTAQLKSWASEYPDFVKLESIGTSAENRELWMLTIGRDPDDLRPAIWIDGNMHASELCGSNAALGIAEDLISIHVGNPVKRPEVLPESVVHTLKEGLAYILPRISPDGAETVLKTGKYVRSSPEDNRLYSNQARWVSKDLDGDGKIRCIRVRDESGEMVESTEYPGLMLPRLLDSDGPFYKMFPEGIIENFDGETIPDPYYLSDNQVDFNRNFPWSWQPEPKQSGAGDYPGSAREIKAVLDFTVKHPNIFFWLNFHTFGGVFIRPASHLPDPKMNQFDLALYRQIGAWGEEFTGYPMVNGFEEFCYEPDTPLHGDATDYAYNQRGCLTYVCELWDFFKQIGHELRKPFIDHYFKIDREDFNRLAEWDKEHNDSRILAPWKKVQHPQLGEVEVGGYSPYVGISNPPYDRIDEILNGQSALALRVAAMAPRINHEVTRLAKSGDTTTLSIEIKNTGYLPSYVIPSARSLPINEPITLEIECEGSLTALSSTRMEIGHLEGYGRGMYNDMGALFFPSTRGTISQKKVRFHCSGSGKLRVKYGNCRMGFRSFSVEI